MRLGEGGGWVMDDSVGWSIDQSMAMAHTDAGPDRTVPGPAPRRLSIHPIGLHAPLPGVGMAASALLVWKQPASNPAITPPSCSNAGPFQ